MKKLFGALALLMVLAMPAAATQQVINTGTGANDGTGDSLRTAFQKVNANTSELYGSVSTLTTALAGKAASVHTHVIGDVTGLSAALSGKVPTTRQVLGGGLATGSGDLSADRTITVPKATGAEASTGTDDTKAVTPLALATPLALKAPLASPAFTGTPTVPTATVGTSTMQAASTAFVGAAIAAIPAASTTLVPPQGRLTLSSGTPVMTSAVTAATSVLYTPDRGNQVPIWNGTAFVMTSFSEVSQALSDTTKSPSAAAAGQVYDYFAWSDGGTVRVTRGPAWSAGTGGSNTVRGTGAGSTALSRVSGLLTNTVAITNGPAAGYGTYVGTIATDSGGATVSWNLGGTAAGGTAAVFNVWNAYNRREVKALVSDSTASWSYASTTLRPANNSSAMRATFVIGFQEEMVDAAYRTYADGGFLGVGLDSTTAYSGVRAQAGTVAAEGAYRGSMLGAHYLQALEWTGGGTANYQGATFSALRFTGSF